MGRPMKTITRLEDMFFWLDKAREGESAVYYRGYLYADRQDREQHGSERLKLADLAWKAYESSKVNLVQQRHGENDYSYIMQSLGVRAKIEGFTK